MQIPHTSTICALSTPSGVSALAVIRLCGTEALAIGKKVFTGAMEPGKAVFGSIQDGGETIDEVVATYFKSPKSFTGEDMIEISCHGGEAVQKIVIAAILDSRARLAKPMRQLKKTLMQSQRARRGALAEKANSRSGRGRSKRNIRYEPR